jgi:hypothetical protein
MKGHWGRRMWVLGRIGRGDQDQDHIEQADNQSCGGYEIDDQHGNQTIRYYRSSFHYASTRDMACWESCGGTESSQVRRLISFKHSCHLQLNAM